jgi:hypothetical protein
MKKLLLLVIVLVTVTSCQEKQRYTQQSPEIETYKKVLKDYELANWESMATHYADTAKIHSNSTKKGQKTVAQVIEGNKTSLASFSTYSFVAEESDYEMVVTDKGETWVNFWGLWQGRLKSTNALFEVPVHLTARFIDGKIVTEHGYWDNTAITLALMAAQSATPAEATTETEEKK